MADKPQYTAYGQTGRDGQTAKERQAQREQEQTANTTEGRAMASLLAKVTALEARLAILENGGNLTAGEGISVNGNMISLNKTWRITGRHSCGDDGKSNFEFNIT